MSTAIEALSAYQLSLDSGNTLPYPYEAARILYVEELSTLRSSLDASNTIKELDNLVGNIDNFATKVPSDFRDVAKLRSDTANRYLELSDLLLNKRNTAGKSCNENTNELLQKVEQSKQGG